MGPWTAVLVLQDKDKVAELERALREGGRSDLAAVLGERFAENLPLTPESLAGAPRGEPDPEP